MVNKIDRILTNCVNSKKATIVSSRNKSVISDGAFFSIHLSIKENDTILMYFRWEFGILGKFIFKRKHQEMNDLYISIKKELTKNSFQLNEPHFISLA